MKKIIRLPEVQDRTGLKHTVIYERIKQGTFPRQVPLTEKAVGWLEHEVEAWIDARAAERDTVEA